VNDMLYGAVALAHAGETLQLMPQRALWLPQRGLLAVADVHFGKAAAFRSHGIPVPSGTTAHNLAVLDALLAASGAGHLMFLGDFLHAKRGRAAATLQALQDWRWRHHRIRMTLVRGNHDRHAGDPPAAMGMDCVDEPATEGPFLFCHHPGHVDPGPGQLAVAGHLHPAFTLAQRRDRLRLPCYLLRKQELILPAFGDFTGGYDVTRSAGDRIFVVTPDAVLAVPP
jgi:DNA ligase-associated metallophosphoesterase